jgi:ubiquitin
MKRTLAGVAILAAAVAAGATAAASTLTLSANPTTVAYGKPTTVSGQLTPAKAGQNVSIQAEDCGTTTFKKAVNVKTTSTGAYTASVTPTTMTTYKATLHTTESPMVVVKVKPVVQLARKAPKSFSVSVSAAASLVGKAVTIQRYSKLRHKWLRVKKVALATMANGTKPTIVSSAAFTSKVKSKTRLRAILPLAQSQPCYLGATSNTVRA